VATHAATDRPLRADAQRNRDALLVVAAAAFADDGPDISLQEIATRAGVGIGTLYRHFPDREALIFAVYERTVAALCEEAHDLLAAHPADQALELWLGRFVEHVRTNRPMTVILKETAGPIRPPQHAEDPGIVPPLFVETHALLLRAIGELLAGASAQGSIRGDAEPADLLRALGGLCQVHATRAQATRLIKLMVDGLRYGAPAAAGGAQAPAPSAARG
jgi:AcrR family transcriptional regulator